MLNKEDLKYIKNDINQTFDAISKVLERTSYFDEAIRLCKEHNRQGRQFMGSEYQLTIAEEARLFFLWRYRDYTAEGMTLAAEEYFNVAKYCFAVYALVSKYGKELSGIAVSDRLYNLRPTDYRID